MDAPLIGVLAIQGGFQAHERVLRRLGVRVREVRTPPDLEGLDGLVLPGGESTAIALGIEREGLAEPLRALARDGATGGAQGEIPTLGAQGGVPMLGSCAGLIMLDREHLGIMDMRAERNAFGRQIASFEAEVAMEGVDGAPLPGVFIRAPWIAEHGPGVDILARVDSHAVAARQGSILAVAFHSELTDDDRVHRLFLKDVEAARRADPARG